MFGVGGRRITILCNHALSFNGKFIARSEFVRHFDVYLISTDTFECCHSEQKNIDLVHSIRLSNELYPMPRPKTVTNPHSMSTQLNVYGKWHRVLGHLGMNMMMKATQLADASHCSTSHRAKHTNAFHASNLVQKRAPILDPIPRNSKTLRHTHIEISSKVSYT